MFISENTDYVYLSGDRIDDPGHHVDHSVAGLLAKPICWEKFNDLPTCNTMKQIFLICVIISIYRFLSITPPLIMRGKLIEKIKKNMLSIKLFGKNIIWEEKLF